MAHLRVFVLFRHFFICFNYKILYVFLRKIKVASSELKSRAKILTQKHIFHFVPFKILIPNPFCRGKSYELFIYIIHLVTPQSTQASMTPSF